jgi:hypothetical protein
MRSTTLPAGLGLCRDPLSGAFLVDEVDQRGLIVVLGLLRLEVRGLPFDDVLSQSRQSAVLYLLRWTHRRNAIAVNFQRLPIDQSRSAYPAIAQCSAPYEKTNASSTSRLLQIARVDTSELLTARDPNAALRPLRRKSEFAV